MSFIIQFKVLLWKNLKIFWRERLKFIALCSIIIISVFSICIIGMLYIYILYKFLSIHLSIFFEYCLYTYLFYII